MVYKIGGQVDGIDLIWYDNLIHLNAERYFIWSLKGDGVAIIHVYNL